MQEKELMSYLSGLMDGDGSFTIGKLKNASPSPLYYPLIQFGFQKKEIVNIFMEKFGGSFTEIDPKKDKRYKQPFFSWRLRSSDNVIPVLEKLIEFLILKKERAEYLLSFCKNFSFKRGLMVDKDILVEREKAYLKMGQMNDCRIFTGLEKTYRPVKNESCAYFWSYVAGIIDSDGSFSIKKQKYQYGQRYNAVISIDMVDPKSIDYIASKTTFGRVEANKMKACTNGICYRLSICKKNDVIAFLENVIPFLRVKKEQAKTLQEFCENWKNTGYCKAGVPLEEMAFREECHQKIKQLNKYGVYKPTLIDLEA
jgi:hypothetical protein